MSQWQPSSALAHVVYEAGFEYDSTQDIIYSRMYALQRQTGYTWTYDVASAHLLMIIDCEPFYFNCHGRNWLVELWKGQYGIETGAEVGVYNVVGSHNANVDPHGLFYNCTVNSELPTIAFTLYKDGAALIRRPAQPHWWLTGFKWGVFTSHTSQLSLDVEIVFRTAEMCQVFKAVLHQRRYTFRERGLTGVAFTFGRPTYPQPSSRSGMEARAQATNKVLVEKYVLLRQAFGFTNNDPNNFNEQTLGIAAARQKIAGEVITAATRIRDDAADISRRFHTLTSSVARNVHVPVPGVVNTLRNQAIGTLKTIDRGFLDVANAYQDIYDLFHKTAWRTSPARRA